MRNLTLRAMGQILRFFVFSAFLIAVTLLAGRFFFPPETLPASAEGAAWLTVIIDAGHGGRDGGAVADDGTLEKHLNLAVAVKLQALLETADVNVVMIREDDRELASPDSSHKKRDDLNARLAIAGEYENAVFVSIHMNKFPVEKYSGLQVYYSKNHEGSRLLAETIQADARTLREENSRTVKAAGEGIFLMEHITLPAVLVECGFLSNHEERELLKTEAYQTKLAMSIYGSLLTYLTENTN